MRTIIFPVLLATAVVNAATPDAIRSIEERAAAYATLTPAELDAMKLRAVQSTAELELVPPKLLTDIPEKYTRAKLDYAMNGGVAITPKGRLWAVWMGGEDGPKSYIVGAWSDDGGRTWTDTKLVVDSHLKDNRLGLLHLNICHQVSNVWCSPDGKLRFFAYQSAGVFSGRAGTWELVCENPDDDVPRWSAPRYLFPGGLHCNPIILKDGTWLYFNDYESTGRENFPELLPFMGCGIYATRDGTALERRGFTYPEGTWHWAEHMAVERPDGTLWMLLRTGLGLMESFSKDKGYTWTKPTPTTQLKTCIARFVLMRLASGRLLFVKNGDVANLAPKAREKMSAYLSDDEGKSWSEPLVLDERSGVSYPDAIQFPDGTIGLTYDHNRGSDAEILFARFTEADILAGEIRSKDSFLKSVVISRKAERERQRKNAK